MMMMLMTNKPSDADGPISELDWVGCDGYLRVGRGIDHFSILMIMMMIDIMDMMMNMMNIIKIMNTRITSSSIISQPNATCSQLSTIVSSTIDSLSTLQGLLKYRSRCCIYILLLGSVKHT